MGVAQGMQHPFHRVVGLPVVMHNDAHNVRQQAAALGRDAIEGQPHGARDVQPLRLAAGPKAGFVQVFDRGSLHALAHRLSEPREALRAASAHPGKGRRHQPHPEQISHCLSQPVLGQQLVVE